MTHLSVVRLRPLQGRNQTAHDSSGGIAALSPRLMAVTPPGSNNSPIPKRCPVPDDRELTTQIRHWRYNRVVASLFATSVFSLIPSLAMADGGTIRLSEQKGDYQITIFTAPTPLRAGPVDVSVLIQNAATKQPLSDVQINIQATHRGHHSVVIRHPATIEAATNKLFRAATFELNEPGWWEIEASIDVPFGETQARFDIEAAEPLPPYLAMWACISWPALPILLFAAHQFLFKRKVGNSSKRSSGLLLRR
jgi:hypothetical protein